MPQIAGPAELSPLLAIIDDKKMGRNLFDRKKTSWLLILVLYIISLLAAFLFLSERGYGYLAMDSFSRSDMGFLWSKEPFFFRQHGVWQPLQFILIGSVSKLLRILGLGNGVAPIVVGIGVNVVFSAIITLVFFDLVRVLFSQKTAWIALLFSVSLPFFMYISLSGLSEPIYIAFILSAIWGFILFLDKKEKKYLFFGSFMALLANMTHMQGWFFTAAFILCLFFTWRQRKELFDSATPYTFLTASVIPLLFPLYWFYLNYKAWGNPLYFIQATKSYEKIKYSLPGYLRVLENMATMGLMAPLIAIIVIFAVTRLVKRWKELPEIQIKYIQIITFQFILFNVPFLLKFSSINSSFSERRYLVLFIFLAIPLAAKYVETLGTSLRVVLVAAVVITNVITLPFFRNPFPRGVYETGTFINDRLGPVLGKGRIVIEKESFAEQSGIPALSKPRERVQAVSTKIIHAQLVNGDFEKKAQAKNWEYLITRNPETVSMLGNQAHAISQVGTYFILELDNHAAVFRSLRPTRLARACKFFGQGKLIFIPADTFALQLTEPIKKGSLAGLDCSFSEASSHRRFLNLSMHDGYGLDYHGQIVQQVTVNGKIVFSHDIGDRFVGWKNVSVPIDAHAGLNKLSVRLISLRDQKSGSGWAGASESLVRNISIR